MWTSCCRFGAVSETGTRLFGTSARALLRLDVAAQVHQRRHRFGDEGARGVGVREAVRAGARQLARAVGVDLRFDAARGAVVEAPEGGDQAAVLPGVADEDLAAGELLVRG